MNKEVFPVELPEGESLRLDRFIASLGLFSRSQMSRRSVRIYDIHGKELKVSKKVADGDVLTVEWDDPPSSDILPEELEMEILYEDSSAVIINKAQGVVVHPAHGHFHGTLVQGLLHKYTGLDDVFGGDRVRPGVVHRLDKDTSGIIVAAMNPEALEFLSKQFRDRSVKKTYLAIVKGVPPSDEGDVDESIGRDPRDRKKFAVGVRHAKSALSRYRVLASREGYSLLKVRILTGRTHQIRVHLKSIGAPILGDPIYGKRDPRFPEATLMLHSWNLVISLPDSGRQRFAAPIPQRFRKIMKELELEIPDADDFR